jgi:hypothetical protein
MSRGSIAATVGAVTARAIAIEQFLNLCNTRRSFPIECASTIAVGIKRAGSTNKTALMVTTPFKKQFILRGFPILFPIPFLFF